MPGPKASGLTPWRGLLRRQQLLRLHRAAAVVPAIRAELNLVWIAMRRAQGDRQDRRWAEVSHLARALMRISMLAQERKDSLVVSLGAFRRHGVRTSGNDDTFAVWQATLQLIHDQ